LRAASRARAASTILLQMMRASLGRSSRKFFSFSPTSSWTTGPTSDETSLSLVCDENLGSGTLIESTQERPSRMSSPLVFDLGLLGDLVGFDVLVQAAGHRGAQSERWVPPSRCGILFREAQYLLLVGVVPLHRDFHRECRPSGRTRVKRRRVQHVLALVDVLDEALHPAGVSEVLILAAALVDQLDLHAVVEERQLAQPLGQDVEMVLDDAEGRGARQEMKLPCRGAPSFR